MGVWVRTPKHGTKLLSFKSYFECTNNIVEYEALILGLDALKYMKERIISIYGDSKLIIIQVKGIYQTKHPIMRAYRNLSLDLLENFKEITITLIPREKNGIANVLDTSTSVLKIPIHPNKKYEIDVKHKPVIPDNIMYWQVFEDDK